MLSMTIKRITQEYIKAAINNSERCRKTDTGVSRTKNV